MSDQKNPFALVSVDETDNIFGQFINFIGGNLLWFVAQVIPPLIGGNDQITLLSEIRKLLSPGIPELGKTMKEKKHRAIGRPGFHHMKFNPVGLNKAFA